MGGAKSTIKVSGRELSVSNPDKVLYPATGTTKADVLEYYVTIAPWLIPHSSFRPATRKRWVDGVGSSAHPGSAFFEKNLPSSAPAWIARVKLAHSDHDNVYPVVNDPATLAWFAQVAALEIHVPQWRCGPRGGRHNPDRLILDLDPGEGAGLTECVAVAKSARTMLQDMGMDGYPVTSGSKGIHLYAGLAGTLSPHKVSTVAHEIARALESQHPELVVSDMRKALRHGKVLVDWSQNSGSKTTVCPYSLRGRDLPTVAAPRTWRELAAADLRQLTIQDVLRRVKRRGDPMAALGASPTDEHEPLANGAPTQRDRLTSYRRKRDSSRTPEPVPLQGDAAASVGNSFVIQEHHASRLHWDFRLEHDGVLVSWALPKGVPTTSTENHLAVQTEDHPLEYGTFEGRIPKGEYGGGDVTIWDHGTFELEKWRENAEVVATLTGTPDGGLGGTPRRFALIHTGHTPKDRHNWLIHLMPPVSASLPIAPMLATPGSAHDITGDDWAVEMKWDGVRAICEVSHHTSRLWSRNGNDITRAFPEIASAMPEAFPGPDIVVDGEVVAFDTKGRPDFGLLQSRLGLTSARSVERAAERVPAHLIAFDVLRLDGHDTTRLSYRQRRELLDSAAVENSEVSVPPAFEGDLDAAMSSSREHGLEGIVAKRPGSPYRAGLRSRDWIKIKHSRTQEVIVVGWQEGTGRRSGGVGSLLLAVKQNGELRYAGKVGTGFSDQDLTDMTAKLRRMARRSPPVEDAPPLVARSAHWVTPRLVGEVQFAEWTASGRLRHPVWRGWRTDKAPDSSEAVECPGDPISKSPHEGQGIVGERHDVNRLDADIGISAH